VGLVLKMLTGSYDVAVFHGDVWSLSTWFAAAAARLRRKRVLFWTIGWHRPDTGFLRVFRMAFYRLANELLLYGNTALALGTDMGYPAERMSVIFNSHESSQQLVTRPSPDKVAHLGPPRPTVGAVIRLTASKRLDLLIEAAALLGERDRPVRVLIAGEGPERARLEELARRLQVQCLFLGAVYAPEDLTAVYDALDVTVVPAAAGLTVIQSLAHGVPVVTDDDRFGQMPEAEAVIEDQTGSRYRAGDVSALALAIDEWVERVRVAPERTSTCARSEVEARWTPSAQADRIADRILDRKAQS
jgi:glycosyltransferase involved in cell wall biosynthesis